MLDPNNPVDIKSLEKCRQIKEEILSFGVSEFELIKLLELLSLELEDTNLMRDMIGLIKKSSSVEEEPKESLVF